MCTQHETSHASPPEVLAALPQGIWVRETFGDAVIEHYLHFFRIEQDKFAAVVTSWERARYCERA